MATSSLVDADLEAPQVEEIALETPTGQSRLAYQLAAVFLLGNIVFGMLSVLTAGASAYIAGFGALVSFPLAIGLLQFRSRARSLAIVMSVIGMLLSLLVTPVPLSPSQISWVTGVTSVLLILAALAAPIALLILLTGQTRPWRLGLALILYGVSQLTGIWSVIASLGQVGAPLDASNFLPLAALTLLSSAILVRFLARDSQSRQWAVILLALAAIAVWVGWCFLAHVPLLSVAFSTAFGLAVAAYLIVRDDQTRSRTVMVFLALMAVLVLMGLCQLAGAGGL